MRRPYADEVLSPTRRRELGAFYTPVDVAARLVAIALDGMDGALRVCDPACGDGVFLLAAGQALEARGLTREHIARELVWGIDVDPAAVAAARCAITAWSGIDPGEHLVLGDGLSDVGWSARFDIVIGNPPFLNQLERATVRTDATRWPAGAYTDTAALFLLAGLDLVRDGGRVLLVQPQSLVAARDAAPIRDAVAARAAITGMWTCDEPVFDASVSVCAPLLVRGARQPARVSRWIGRTAEPARAAARPAARPTARPVTWSGLLASARAVPPVALDGRRTLRDIATATAGFRDQFYGLAPFVIEKPEADEHAFPRLVTCGVIDPGGCAWGERTLRFAGQRWQFPRVDLAQMSDCPLRRWVTDRLVAKVVLATQTKVLEAAVDRDGTLVPSTPVIAVHSDALFDVAAVLLSPPVSAWALATYAGVALAPDAIKLSARQVLDVPLPGDVPTWQRAAASLADGDVQSSAALMTEAYGSGPEVLEWWTNRVNRRRSG